MALEAAAIEGFALTDGGRDVSDPLRLVVDSDGSAVLDWEPLIFTLLGKSSLGAPPSLLAAQFHAALADGILAAARHAEVPRVALTGGCFQNRLLTELSTARLRSAGFEPLLHGSVPPNDGGIGLGQVLVAAERLKHLHRGTESRSGLG